MAKSKKSKSKSKSDKKSTTRTPEQRQSEITTLREKLDSLGLGPDSVKEVDTFFKTIVKDYLQFGAPASGSFPLPGYKRVLEYTLSTRLVIPVSFNLPYREDI